MPNLCDSGQIMQKATEYEDLLYVTLDPAKMAEYRTNIPILQQKRYDIYR